MTYLILSLLATGLYAAAGASLAWRLAHAPQAYPMRILALFGVGIALALHAGALALGAVSAGRLDLNLFNSGSVIGWLMAALLLAAMPRRPVESLGVVVFPLVGLVVVTAAAFARTVRDTAPLVAGVDVHILFSVFAYSVLALAALQSILLAIQENRLRRHRPGGLVRLLPPLHTMELLLFDMLHVGFALLTVALASGFLFVDDLLAQHLVHKTVLSLVAWVLFGALILGRYRYGWRGQTAARWTLGGFAMLMLGFFGSKLVLELVLA